MTLAKKDRLQGNMIGWNCRKSGLLAERNHRCKTWPCTKWWNTSRAPGQWWGAQGWSSGPLSSSTGPATNIKVNIVHVWKKTKYSGPVLCSWQSSSMEKLQKHTNLSSVSGPKEFSARSSTGVSRTQGTAQVKIMSKKNFHKIFVSLIWARNCLLQVLTRFKLKFYTGCFILNCIGLAVIFICEKANPGGVQEMMKIPKFGRRWWRSRSWSSQDCVEWMKSNIVVVWRHISATLKTQCFGQKMLAIIFNRQITSHYYHLWLRWMRCQSLSHHHWHWHPKSTSKDVYKMPVTLCSSLT